MENLRYVEPAFDVEERVNVIRHDAPRVQEVILSVSVEENVRDLVAMVPQDAGSISRIEASIELESERSLQRDSLTGVARACEEPVVFRK